MRVSSDASRKTTRGRTPARLLDALEHRLEVLEPDPAADVADHRRALDPRALEQEQVGQRGQQAGRQVVDAEPAGVLEGAHRLALPGAAHAGDDRQLHAASPPRARRAARPRSARRSCAGGRRPRAPPSAAPPGRPRARPGWRPGSARSTRSGAAARPCVPGPTPGSASRTLSVMPRPRRAAVVAQREAVGLVADVLQHAQRRRALVQQERVGDARAGRPPRGAWRGSRPARPRPPRPPCPPAPPRAGPCRRR